MNTGPAPRGGAVLLVAGLLLTLAGCASSTRTRVILLPQADGTPSAVVVQSVRGDTPVRLDQPYGEAEVGDGPSRLSTLTPPQVRDQNRLLFDLLPARAAIYTVLFEAGVSVPDRAGRAILESALRDALARPGGEIFVIGHTDTVGATARNVALSVQRAQQVEAFFLGRGFPAERIRLEGRGQNDLAVTTPSQQDEPRNRRVVVRVR